MQETLIFLKEELKRKFHDIRTSEQNKTSITPFKDIWTVFERQNCIAFIFDAETLKFYEVNDFALTFYNLSKPEFLEKSILDINCADETEFYQNLYDLFYSNKSEFNTTHSTSKKELLTHQSYGCIDNKIFVLAITRDITEKSKLESILAESEKRYRAIVNNSPDGIIIHSKGKVVFANPSAARILCFPTTERMIGETMLNYVHPDFFEADKNRTNNVNLEDETITNLQEKFIRFDGESIDVEILESAIDFNGQIAIQIVFRDITKKIITQAKLIESEEKYRLLAENTNDVISKLNPEGLFTFCTPSSLLILGYSPQELENTSLWQYLHPDELEVFIEENKKLSPLRESYISRYRFRKKNGEYTWIETSSKLIFQNEQLKEIISISRDINHIIQKEQLIKDKETAEAANNTKTAFLQNMSHEIRNPMNAIIGLTNILSRSTLNENQRNLVNSIQLSSYNLHGILNNILDFSKTETSDIEINTDTFLLSTLENNIKAEFGKTAEEKGIELIFAKIDKVNQLIIGDFKKTKQILQNIVSNAIKFTKKGKVTVELQYAITNNSLLIKVSDTGVGIKKEDIAKLFDSFYQLDSSFTKEYAGTGLGLAIVKKQVNLLKGTIDVDSSEGLGSTFTVSLPFQLKKIFKSSHTIQNEKKQTRIDSSNIQILIVEDDAINQLYLRNFLTEKNFKIDSAKNGLQAIEKYKEHNFDLILMDGQMPKMDGFEATRQIRLLEKELNKPVKIIAITGYAIKGDKEKFIEAGMNAYISKPIDENILLTTIEELLTK